MIRFYEGEITDLVSNEIFVFGSNLAGQHAGGAAKTAVEKFGAVNGQGIGLQGRSYAIPSMSGLFDLATHVRDFLNYAKSHKQLVFYVTKVGCGIAGLKESAVKGLFKNVPENVALPIDWRTTK